ncbi:aminotransferase, class V family protein [Tritrichomonas foetus]|uniref:phosphoserine transaminase n=1 Tax=Tritrichomonas foetus TaxID=1144522 RepID=A0A1J4J370_9EUKA|nr:aminotransferase, class V family protein [Tritrichomonas foetus]|eukprot:OHS93896.1 aminotransferase, class V family protein [Tritrichomonas foetus]
MENERVYNFSAGPACVPQECLEKAASEMMNWQGTGMSVIEHSHRGKWWTHENEDVSNRVRLLLKVPENFEILFVAGGASLQFSAIPFNLLGGYKKVDYVITGTWSQKAYEECVKLDFPGIEVRKACPLPPVNPVDIPDRSTWDVSPDAAYCYICSNETIQGIQFDKLPDVPTPLVIDMSSELFSRQITEWNKIGLIFACAQKNFGVSGMTIVIVRKDLLERPLQSHCPTTLDFRVQVKNKCLYNTPPTFAIYFANLIFKWIEAQGGIERLEEINREKARKVYEAIDNSPFFENRVKPEYRSIMNIPFFRKPDGYEVKNQELDNIFLNLCSSKKIMALKGHASVGGFRASIYNAMPAEGIDAFINVIKEFQGFA